MATKEQMEKVKNIVVKLRYLECMDNIIYYDRWNNCPKDGFDYEGKVGAYLTELSNEKLTSKETKELVESLEGETAFDSDTDKGMVRYLIGKYKEAVQIPASLQGELNQANADGQLAWGKCYEADDFESFKPVLKKQFDLQEKIATAINPDEKPYQVLVNRFDKDYRLEEIDAILAKIKDAVCEILNAVREEQSKIDDSILECEADHDTVLRIVKKAQEILGLDKDKSTLFEIHHPVCVCTGPRDSRPSTNCDELIHAILAVVHETGHGLYNYNANDEVAESGLWGGIEGAMHESQSRFYENHVGRTREFWENLYPYLQKEVPKYKEISLDTFLAALNKVKPGLIRLKADELTNTLHIIIRYEIEKEYFDGKLTVDTIEEAWNRKYQEYLGFTPKNHQEGILQDVHWASGCVGYFQGYALGDAYAAQFAHKLLADCPDAFEKLGKGDSSVIGNWLKEHIHQYGQTYSTREMLKKATGEELNTGYYIEYLKEKYHVILVENPYYKQMNNFSTLYVAREYLKNTWICSADNYFTENVFMEESENAFYASEYADGATEEWCIKTDNTGKITGVQIGGENAWVMKGHVFFNEKFSTQLLPYLEEAFQKKELWDEYWENLYMVHMDEMEMYIRKYDAGIIEEFDSIDELREFDVKYKECTGSKVLREISEKLNCPEGKMTQMKPVKSNGEVIGFEFFCDGKKYEYSYTSGLKTR